MLVAMMQGLILAFDCSDTFGKFDVKAVPGSLVNEKFDIKMAELSTKICIDWGTRKSGHHGATGFTVYLIDLVPGKVSVKFAGSITFFGQVRAVLVPKSKFALEKQLFWG